MVRKYGSYFPKKHGSTSHFDPRRGVSITKTSEIDRTINIFINVDETFTLIFNNFWNGNTFNNTMKGVGLLTSTLNIGGNDNTFNLTENTTIDNTKGDHVLGKVAIKAIFNVPGYRNNINILGIDHFLQNCVLRGNFNIVDWT